LFLDQLLARLLYVACKIVSTTLYFSLFSFQGTDWLFAFSKLPGFLILLQETLKINRKFLVDLVSQN